MVAVVVKLASRPAHSAISMSILSRIRCCSDRGGSGIGALSKTPWLIFGMEDDAPVALSEKYRRNGGEISAV